jgi:hypothetical protein
MTPDPFDPREERATPYIATTVAFALWVAVVCAAWVIL